MRRRSITGPLILLIIGALFLWRNLHPEAPVFDIIATYWPFLLIGWGLLRILELAFIRDGRPMGFSGGEVALVIFICIAGSIAWAAHQHGFRIYDRGLAWWGTQYDYNVSASAPSAGIKRLIIDDPRGNVKVTGSDATDITVTGHKTIRSYSKDDADRTDKNTVVELVPQGDHLLLRTNQDHAPDNQQVSDDLEIVLPKSIAVEGRGHSGDLEMSDLSSDVDVSSDRADARLERIGGNVHLEINRSDLIRVADLKGRLDMQGGGGDVELENISGPVTISGSYTGTLDFKNLAKPLQFQGRRNTELNVQAVPGHLAMDLGEVNGTGLTGPIRLVANSRDIRLEQFTQSLELETARGDIELHPSGSPLPSIDARSGAGRIDLILPEKAQFQLDGTAERGEAYNDWGSGITQENERGTATIKGNIGNGPMIRLNTNRGRISVRKEGAPAPDEGLKETKM